jgi:hypothetical protein
MTLQNIVILSWFGRIRLFYIGKAKAYTYLELLCFSNPSKTVLFLYYNKGEKTYKYLEDKLNQVRFLLMLSTISNWGFFETER